MATPLRLITIGFSHYCEKARWALDRTEAAYREECHVPLLHWSASLRLGGGRMVPKLVTRDGVLSSSTEILHFADELLPPPLRLFPADPTLAAEVMQWVDDFDRRLGPAVRRWLYWMLLPHRNEAVALLASAGPAWQRRVTPVLFPVMRALMRRGMNVQEKPAERSRQRVLATFAAVAERLADGRQFLVGDKFSAADLTFAALAAPFVWPDNHGFPRRDSLGQVPAIANAVAELRDTPAGRFVLRLYANERPAVRAL